MEKFNQEAILKEIKARPDVKRLNIAKTVFTIFGAVSIPLVMILVLAIKNKSIAVIAFFGIWFQLAIICAILGAVFNSKYKSRINQVLQMRMMDATNAALEASKNSTEETKEVEKTESESTADAVETVKTSSEEKSEQKKTPEECKALADKVVKVYVKGNILSALLFFIPLISALILAFIPICKVKLLDVDISLFNLLTKRFADEKGLLPTELLIKELGNTFAKESLINEISLYAFFLTSFIFLMGVLMLIIMPIMLTIYNKRIRDALETPEKQMLFYNHSADIKNWQYVYGIIVLPILFLIFYAGLLLLPIEFLIWAEGAVTVNYATLIFGVLFILVDFVIVIYMLYYQNNRENKELYNLANKIVRADAVKRNPDRFI